MGKVELNFVFHNPNTKEDTIYYITKILVKAGERKLERIIEEEQNKKLVTQSRDF